MLAATGRTSPSRLLCLGLSINSNTVEGFRANQRQHLWCTIRARLSRINSEILAFVELVLKIVNNQIVEKF